MEIICRNLVGPSEVRALPLGFAEELKCPVFAWATNSQEVLLLNTGFNTVVFIHLVRAALVRCHRTMRLRIFV